jgi:hypothetical protein
MERLKDADVVLVDVTDNNSNVSYELGLTQAWCKPCVIVSTSSDSAAWWPAKFNILQLTGKKEQDRREIQQRLRDSWEEGSASKHVSSLTDVHSHFERFRQSRNPLLARVGGWRLSTAIEQLASLKTMRWTFDTHPPALYVAHNFQALLALLEPGDQYLTTTNLGFWSLLTDTTFLEANRKAAARGVVIRRAFLVDNRDRGRSSTREILERHLATERELKRKGARNLQTRVCVGKERDLRDQHGHFALLRIQAADHDGPALLVEPDYGTGELRERILRLSLSFSAGDMTKDRNIMDSYNKFEQAWARGVPVANFLSGKRKRLGR